MKNFSKTCCLTSLLVATVILSACQSKVENNLLLKQRYSDDRQNEYSQSADFLFRVASIVQPKINKTYGLNANRADFYIACMQDKVSSHNACDALYKAMASRAQEMGKPNIVDSRSYVGLSAEDIQNKTMWRTLSSLVITDNQQRSPWDAN